MTAGMTGPAIDNLHDPTKPEVYYFDDRAREQVLAKQAARGDKPAVVRAKSVKKVAKAAKKAAKKR